MSFSAPAPSMVRITRLDLSGLTTGSIDVSAFGGYSHIEIVGKFRSAAAVGAINAWFRFNTDTTAIYDECRVMNSNTTAIGEPVRNAQNFSLTICGTTGKAGAFSPIRMLVQDFRGNQFKEATWSFGAQWADADANTRAGSGAGVWESTAAINTVDLLTSDGSAFAAGSFITVYALL